MTGNDDDGITGHTITAVRRPTAAEYAAQGWDDVWDRCVVLELDNGTTLFPSSDEEGNNPGVLFGEDHGVQFQVEVPS